MASSQKRTDANRENARRSTGPLSQTGKDQSRRNGISHGLTATALLLDDESPEEYQALVDATITDLTPQSERERVLAVHVADTLWRRQRLYRAEAAFINVRTRAIKAENPDIRNSAEATAMLLTAPEDANRMRLLLRYLAAAERACNRAVRDFYAVRKEEERTEHEAAADIRAATRAAFEQFDALEARDHARATEIFLTMPGEPTPEPEAVPAHFDFSETREGPAVIAARRLIAEWELNPGNIPPQITPALAYARQRVAEHEALCQAHNGTTTTSTTMETHHQ